MLKLNVIQQRLGSPVPEQRQLKYTLISEASGRLETPTVLSLFCSPVFNPSLQPPPVSIQLERNL